MCNRTDTLKIHVSGKQFKISMNALQRFPSTKLGSLSRDSCHFDPKTEEFFFDRNPKMMSSILDLYRTGSLHLPGNLCAFAIKSELEFWDIDEDMISECCWKRYAATKHDVKVVDMIEKSIIYDQLQEKSDDRCIQHKIWMTLGYPNCSIPSKVWFTLYMLMVVLAVTTACLSVSPDMRFKMEHLHPQNNSSSLWDMLINTEMKQHIYTIDLACLLFFTLDLLLKVTFCPSKHDFFKEPLNIMDLILTGIMWASVVLDHIPAMEDAQVVHTVLRALFCLNSLRILHIGRSFHGVKLLLLTLTASMEAIGILLVSTTMAVVIYGTLVYFAEVTTNADTFKSIPVGIWWATVTMTTVGYGDFVPESWPGYVIGIVCAVSGIVLLSLPIAVVASNFNTYYLNMSSADQRIRRRRLIGTLSDTEYL